MDELFFSVDVETDGPIPGPHSMLSLGCVALDAEGQEHGAYSVNLHTLPGASAHPKTAAWWKTQPKAWAACRADLVAPEAGMTGFVTWVEAFEAREKCLVCYPSGFDFTFVLWYMMSFVGRTPFNFQCIDVRSFVMGLRGKHLRQTSKRYWPRRWQNKLPHTHVALDDAREQGLSFIAMLQESRKRVRSEDDNGPPS